MQVFTHDWVDLFKLYFNRDISVVFIDCANNRILGFLEESLPGSSKHTRVRWDSGGSLMYTKGRISLLQSKFSFVYGHLPVNIKWHSQSGRIYDIADTDINCADIVFELEGLDTAKMSHLIKPKWSLVTFPETIVERLQRHHKRKISLEFIKCADDQLSKQFETRTGIKINRNVCISIPVHGNEFLYGKNVLSKLSIDLIVNGNGNSLFILWKSKSHKIYDLADTGIPCDDIEFWFDDSFDALLYHKQLYPKVELPFNLKNLPFEVIIERLNIDCILTMTLKDDALSQAEEAIQKIDTCINDFNIKAEKNEEDAVHNWRTEVEDNRIICEMDTGFAGPEILKTLFRLFAKMNIFSKVTVQ